MSSKNNTVEINQISVGSYLPSDAEGNISERERDIAIAIADEMLNIALYFYVEMKQNPGQEPGQDFFQNLAQDKSRNEVQVRLLKCYAENISRINFKLLPDDAKSAILNDLLSGKVFGQKVPKEVADEVLSVINSEGDNLDAELLDNLGISSSRNNS